MQRLLGIHGLRAVAAMGIVLIHIVGVTQFVVAPPVIDKIIPLCMLSVPLFFVVSAFSLAYAHDGSVGRDGWIWPYMIKRLFRIAPLFYVMLLVWRWAGWPPQTPGLLLLNVTFLFGFVPGQHESLVWAGWSVGVEMPFYVAFPFILERVRRLSHGFALLVVAAAISIVARIWIASLPSLPAHYSYMSIPSNVAFFAAGLVGYQYFAAWRKHPIVWRWTAAVTVGCLLFLPFRERMNYPRQPDWVAWSCVFGLLCAWQAATPTRWLSSAPMQWLGERSYSLYLLHPFVIFLLLTRGVYAWIWNSFNPMIGTWAFLPCAGVTFAILIPAAGVTYLLIERPGQKAGGMIIKRYRTTHSMFQAPLSPTSPTG